jgi:hypothetical protein
MPRISHDAKEFAKLSRIGTFGALPETELASPIQWSR